MNLQGEKHVFFMGKTQLVPAGYVVNKLGLGGVGVGPQQNRNSHMPTEGKRPKLQLTEVGWGRGRGMRRRV